MEFRQKADHVCGQFAQPPACSSSKTFSPGDSQFCGFSAKCSDPSSHIPSAYRCSCWLSRCKHINRHISRKTTLNNIQEQKNFNSLYCQKDSILVMQLDNLITVLLQVIQMLDLILVALYSLSISFLQVNIFHSKKLLLVVKNLVDLTTKTQLKAIMK